MAPHLSYVFKTRNYLAESVYVLQFMSCTLRGKKKCALDFLEDVAGFVINVGGTRGARMSAKRPSSTCVLATILVCNFTVVVLVRRAAQQPASCSEFQDLQQQQAGHGGEALLQQEAVPQ